MKLTGVLKEQVKKAETKEEKKSLIEGAWMELADEDMEKVSGGGIPLWNKYVKAIRGRMANKPVQLKRKKACYNEEHNGNE